MPLDTIASIALVGGALSFLAALYFGRTAFVHARPWFPAPLQEEVAARFAIDRFIWSGGVPRSARRNWLLGRIFSSVAFLFFALYLFGAGQIIGALLFAVVTVIVALTTFRFWRRYRLDQPTASPPSTAP